jgi:transcriptional regulator with XRE-family HTH domain
MRELQDVIRGARTDAGLTQAEFAVRAGTSQPAIARYEQGTRARGRHWNEPFAQLVSL